VRLFNLTETLPVCSAEGSVPELELSIHQFLGEGEIPTNGMKEASKVDSNSAAAIFGS
jgi:hypothetical protein